MNRHCFASFIVTALMVAVGGRADAIERRGFVIGFGAGVGHTRVEGESNTAIGTNFHVGGMLGSRTALLLDGYGVTDSEDDVTVSIGVSAIAVQRFVGNRGWLKFGLGSGYAFASGDGRSEWEDAGFGILAGAGYELVQKNKFTLDLQGRFSTSSKDSVRVNNFGIGLGFNWW